MKVIPSLFLSPILLLFFFCSHAQQSNLDDYIRQGFQNNLSLKRAGFQLDKSIQALAEARGMFYPSISFQSDYLYASGGRKIDLPLGDLFNPLYSTLNQMIGSPRFGDIANQEVLFNPNDYHDTRLVTTMPLINGEIYYNYKLHKEAITQKQAELRVYQRMLVREIKVAYYQVMSARKQIEIYENAGRLLQQNYELTQSLILNGKALKGNAIRILADINNNRAKLTESTNNRRVAIAYFNFLLNKPLEDTVTLTPLSPADSLAAGTNSTAAFSTDRREELTALRSALRQADYNITLKKTGYIPNLSAFVNTGYQGNYFRFNSDTRYVFGGFSLKWELFGGNQVRRRVDQAQSDFQILETSYKETDNQIRLQVVQAESELNTARQQVERARSNLRNYEEFYREMSERYQQGMVLLVELNDAYTQLINGQLALELSTMNLQFKLAGLEQVTAAYPL